MAVGRVEAPLGGLEPLVNAEGDSDAPAVHATSARVK